jgi:lipid-binding SYLF domain-containing protein
MEKAIKTIREAVKAIDKIMSEEDSRIPLALFEKCEGLVIFPGAFKVAVGALGGQGGRGSAMIRKEDGSWSNPFFIWMSEGSVGAQIGAQSSDIILLFKNRKNIMRMEEAEIKLGGDISATAGPENKEISAGTDITFESEIYSYSRSKGLFAGVSVSGGVLIYNDELNDVFYDHLSVTVDEIFYRFQTPFNTGVMELIKTLNKYTGYEL